jgi:hypothetical protein
MSRSGIRCTSSLLQRPTHHTYFCMEHHRLMEFHSTSILYCQMRCARKLCSLPHAVLSARRAGPHFLSVGRQLPLCTKSISHLSSCNSPSTWCHHTRDKWHCPSLPLYSTHTFSCRIRFKGFESLKEFHRNQTQNKVSSGFDSLACPLISYLFYHLKGSSHTREENLTDTLEMKTYQ